MQDDSGRMPVLAFSSDGPQAAPPALPAWGRLIRRQRARGGGQGGHLRAGVAMLGFDCGGRSRVLVSGRWGRGRGRGRPPSGRPAGTRRPKDRPAVGSRRRAGVEGDVRPGRTPDDEIQRASAARPAAPGPRHALGASREDGKFPRASKARRPALGYPAFLCAPTASPGSRRVVLQTEAPPGNPRRPAATPPPVTWTESAAIVSDEAFLRMQKGAADGCRREEYGERRRRSGRFGRKTRIGDRRSLA